MKRKHAIQDKSRSLKNTMIHFTNSACRIIPKKAESPKIPVFQLSCFLLTTIAFASPATCHANTFVNTCSSGYILSGGLDKSQYVEMTSPDEDNMRIRSISQFSSYAYDFRMAIYLDAGGGDPVGAAKIYDSGPLTHPGGGNMSFILPTLIDLPKNTKFGLATKWDPAGSYTLNRCGTPNAGFTFYSNENNESSAVGNSLVPFQDTITSLPGPPAGDYIYTVEIGHKPVITSVTSPFNDGGTATATGTGFDVNSGTAIYVWLTENNDWNNPGIKVSQAVQSKTATSVGFTINACGLYEFAGTTGNKAYLWVEDAGGIPDSGFEVTIDSYLDTSPPSPHSSPTVFPTMEVIPDTGTYVPATLTTIQDSFKDLDSVITSCQYTLDGGASWNNANLQYMPLSDAGRCTVNNIPAGADGTPLTVQMRAHSCGGWSTPPPTRTLDRTVDSTGPLDGSSFVITPGTGECSLAWSATTDSRSGMDPTYPYAITANADTPPADCAYTLNRIYRGTDTTVSHTALEPGKTYYYKLCYMDVLGNFSQYGGNPGTCTLNGITVGDGTAPPTTGWIKKAATNYPISSFSLASHPTPNTVTDLTVTGTNTANIGAVKIYRDNGSAPNEFDPGDTFIASAAFSGTQAVFSGLNIPVSTTAEQYLITFDTIAAPTMFATVSAYVSEGTGGFAVVSHDTVDNIPQIDSQDPVTAPTFTVPSAWQGSEYTMQISRNDGSGSGFPPINTSLWGCFGAGCTPGLLATNSMTTSCGAGNACILDARYYSMDIAGNVEQIKTNPTQIKIDRSSPAGGTFTAYANSNPVVLAWSGFTDTGSGISSYKILRADGTTPPVDCTSGSQRYFGTANQYDDASVSSGQTYSYRLCAYDTVGNIASNHIATVTAGEPCLTNIMCESCHGPNVPGMGGSKLNPPMGHVLHGPDCGACHREGAEPSHVDGWVTISPLSGYMGGDSIWPGGGGGMTCGGPGNPVGGDINGGFMGCHVGGTPNYPGITPEWECMWNEFPMCNPPSGP